MNIGILSLQGSIIEHINAVKALKHNPIPVKLPEHLENISALIIPGGESTTMIKLLQDYKLDRAIIAKHSLGLPIYGTCAGSILLAKDVTNYNIPTLGLLDISIKRNDYGRQIDSFETEVQINNFLKPFPAIFIRAPIVHSYHTNSQILSEFNNSPVMLKQNNILITTFHPELTSDLRVHKYFIDMIQ